MEAVTCGHGRRSIQAGALLLNGLFQYPPIAAFRHLMRAGMRPAVIMRCLLREIQGSSWWIA
jgi:hypothetical protein